MIDVDFLLKELRKRCKNDSIKITKGIKFEYDEPSKTLYLTMNSGNGIKKNMQEDSAAFEGWALAFKANLADYINSIVLDWDEPIIKNKSEWKHFNRFLYRVDRFENIYGNWFKAPKKDRWNEQIKTKGWNQLVLNKPGNRTVDEAKEYALSSEHSIESYFTSNDRLKKEIIKYGIELDYIHNQFPVGVFNEVANSKKAVFNGGKSAIDLYGEDKKNGSFNIFELKAENNVKIGIVSELFFYTSIIKDAIEGKIQWENPEKVDGYEVNSFFLVPRLHPLITDAVIKMLNIVKGVTYRKLIYKINDIRFE